MEAKAKEEKGFFGKLKDAAEDQEHQIQILSSSPPYFQKALLAFFISY